MRALAYRKATLTFIALLHYWFLTLQTTDLDQQHKRQFCVTRGLIQSNNTDMNLDPDSLSQVDEAFISAELI